MRVVVALLCVMLVGCFGYNPSAKRWSYVGDTVLVAAGGGMIGLGATRSDPEPCGPAGTCVNYNPVSGYYIAGAVLVTAGILGIVINATRSDVKLSR